MAQQFVFVEVGPGEMALAKPLQHEFLEASGWSGFFLGGCCYFLVTSYRLLGGCYYFHVDFGRLLILGGCSHMLILAACFLETW